jgi:hypothetical protein
MAKGLQVEQFLAGWTDGVGQPLSGGKVFSYAAGTNTLQPLYNDKDCLNAATNPVILDSNGRAQVYANSSLSYKFVVKTSADVTLYTLDHLFYPREALFSDSGSGYNITNTTSDGSDTKRLLFNGGGGSGSGRGAEIQLHGNESAGNTGVATISSGNISAATVDLNIIPANGKLRILLNGVSRWEFDAATNSILPTANNAHDVGSSSFRVRNVFAQTLNSSGARGDGYFSTLDIPVQTWTPTITATAPMTVVGAPTITRAAYSVLGKFVLFSIQYIVELGGTPTTTIAFSIPVTATTFGAVSGMVNGGTLANSPTIGQVGSTTITMRKRDGSTWANDTYTFRVNGIYEAS